MIFFKYLPCYKIKFFIFIFSEIETLKVVKTQSQLFKTPNIQHFKTALYETETITLLELPSLAPSTKNVSDTQVEVCTIFYRRMK